MAAMARGGPADMRSVDRAPALPAGMQTSADNEAGSDPFFGAAALAPPRADLEPLTLKARLSYGAIRHKSPITKILSHLRGANYFITASRWSLADAGSGDFFASDESDSPAGRADARSATACQRCRRAIATIHDGGGTRQMRLSISKAFAYGGYLILAGLLALLAVSTVAVERLRIGGAAYERIITGKDIVADILPPPAYVIEAYQEALVVARKPNSAAIHLDRLAQLRNEYQARRDFGRNRKFCRPISRTPSRARTPRFRSSGT